MSTSTCTETVTTDRHSSSPFSPIPLTKQRRFTRREEDTKPYKVPSPSLQNKRHSAVTRNSAAQATPHEVKSIATPYPAVENSSVQSNYFPDQDACDKVLRFITQPYRKIYSAVFHNITEDEYHNILHISENSLQKPRLAYNRSTLTLTVDMPSEIHEAVINVVNPGMKHADDLLRAFLPRRCLDSDSHTGLTIRTRNLEFIPDLAHVVTALCDPPVPSILVVGEVAFSQSRARVLERLRDTIDSHPDIVMLLMFDIVERRHVAPKPNSTAWETLRLEANVRSSGDFLSERTGERSLDRPKNIIVADHAWCSIQTVHVQVWIRGKHPIDVDTQNPALMASGDLFPTMTLDRVTLMFEKGLRLMARRYADLARKACPLLNVDALIKARISLPFEWKYILSKLALAVLAIAYTRYTQWHDKVEKTQSEGEGPWMFTRSRTANSRGHTAVLGRGRLRRRCHR